MVNGGAGTFTHHEPIDHSTRSRGITRLFTDGSLNAELFSSLSGFAVETRQRVKVRMTKTASGGCS